MSASPSMKYNVEAFHIHTTPSQRDFKARRGCVSRARLVFGYLFINPSTLYGDYAEARGERERASRYHYGHFSCGICGGGWILSCGNFSLKSILERPEGGGVRWYIFILEFFSRDTYIFVKWFDWTILFV